MHVGARAHVRVCAGVCDGDVSGVTCACVTLLCVRVPRACLCVCTGRRASPPAMFTCTNVGACGSLEHLYTVYVSSCARRHVCAREHDHVHEH